MKIISAPQKELLDRFVEFFSMTAAAAIARHGIFCLALSGGRTPRLYHQALIESSFNQWGKTHIFLVDERFVPFDHDDNNFKMIKETLLDHIDVPDHQIHAMPVDEENPQQTVQVYQQHLHEVFGGVDYPVFDLVMLGLGEDGHTASLFSQTDAEIGGWVTATSCDHLPYDRVTLTMPVLNQATNIAFFIVGAQKKDVFDRVCAKDSAFAASFVQPEGKLLAFIDF